MYQYMYKTIRSV